ncbi:MAG: hypothetical protein JRJ87_14470 [Deltaproteobacteria bacterium]|nr:hypothetical protein [Deltaproteobacteria bacterium]
MDWWIFIPIGLVLVGLVIFIATRKKPEDFNNAIRRLGLSNQGGVLRGQIQGFSIAIETQAIGEDKQRWRTIFYVEFPSRLGLGFMTTSVRGGRRSLKAIDTGDAEFDNLVSIETQNAQKVQDYLTTERRECLVELFKVDPNAWLDDGGIHMNVDGAIDDYAILKPYFDGLLDMAIDLFPGRAARKAVRRASKLAD